MANTTRMRVRRTWMRSAMVNAASPAAKRCGVPTRTDALRAPIEPASELPNARRPALVLNPW
jgi:hypothetical protein